MNNPSDDTDSLPRFHALADEGGPAYDSIMARGTRRVAAQSAAHAQGLADNLSKQGFVVESQTASTWVLRKKRLLGDEVVTIDISQPSMLRPSPSAQPPPSWAPPRT